MKFLKITCNLRQKKWRFLNIGVCLTSFGKSNVSNTRDSVSSGYPNTEKRVENMMHSRVFLTKFDVFG